MLSAIYPAYTGLAAFATQIAVTAHNLANVNTNGFKKSRTEFVALETGGVLPVIQKNEMAGPAILNDTGYGPAQLELSNVDLGEEAVNQIIGQRGFEANLQILKTADDMLGSILDIKK
jgi:flagellar basal-body rod protein FlgC